MRLFLLSVFLMLATSVAYAFDGGWVARLPEQAASITNQLQIATTNLAQMQEAISGSADANLLAKIQESVKKVIADANTLLLNREAYLKDHDEATRSERKSKLKDEIAKMILLAESAIARINAQLALLRSPAIVADGITIRQDMIALKINLEHWDIDYSPLPFRN